MLSFKNCLFCHLLMINHCVMIWTCYVFLFFFCDWCVFLVCVSRGASQRLAFFFSWRAGAPASHTAAHSSSLNTLVCSTLTTRLFLNVSLSVTCMHVFLLFHLSNFVSPQPLQWWLPLSLISASHPAIQPQAPVPPASTPSWTFGVSFHQCLLSSHC